VAEDVKSMGGGENLAGELPSTRILG